MKIDQTVLTEAEADLVTRNMEAFSRYRQDLFNLFVAMKPESRLIWGGEDEEDGRDIEFHGARLYRMGGKIYADAQMMDPVPHTRRLTLSPPKTAGLDHIAGAYVHDLLKATVDDGVTLLQLPNTEESFHLIVLGIGLGYHLDALIDRSKARSICLIEPNIEFLYHSLATYDWSKLLEWAADQPRALTIVVSDHPEYVAHEMRNHVRFNSPAHVDWLQVFMHYPNNGLAHARDMFLRDAHLLPTGLGFVEDEIEMVRASYYNLSGGHYLLYQPLHKNIKTPAFVIGSGPSIDPDLDFLRENQDRAIIIACGSAMGVLLANGIQPDFEMQMENGDLPRDIIAKVAETFDISRVTLVASTTCSPKMKGLFEKAILYFRQGLSSYALFAPGDGHRVEEVGPTVANLGLSFAQEIGCREFYLFGIDLGSRAKQQHHSKYAPYTQGGLEGDYMGEDTVKFHADFPRTAPANFGGIVHSEDGFLWSRDVLERSIRYHSIGRTYYNCSDGLAIEGATPRVSESIEITSSPETKAKELEEILGAFQAVGEPDGRVLDNEAVVVGVREFMGRIRDICQSDKPFGAIEVALLRELINDRFRKPTFEEHVFRGSLLLMFICNDFYEKRIHPAEKRPLFREHARSIMLKYIDRMEDEVIEFIMSLQ